MVFDISFRSGVINGIVFFDQVIESFKVGWYGDIIIVLKLVRLLSQQRHKLKPYPCLQ